MKTAVQMFFSIIKLTCCTNFVKSGKREGEKINRLSREIVLIRTFLGLSDDRPFLVYLFRIIPKGEILQVSHL